MSEVTVYLASDLHPSEHVVLQPDFDSCEFDLNHAQSELAALREELATVNRSFDELAGIVGFSEDRLKQTGDSPMDCATALQQRLADAERRNADDIRDAERYRELRKITPYRFKKIQDASVTDGGDVLYFHADRFDAQLDELLPKPTEPGASDSDPRTVDALKDAGFLGSKC